MPENLQKARELFLHAVGKLSPAEWDAHVSQACGGDADLEQQVRRFLDIHREAGSFLDAPVAPLVGTIDEPVSEASGTVIGPYKLLEQIGEGGFGAVFMAEQMQPVRRKVALKVLKPGMDTRQVVARFEAERQALAIMDHPNIAKVLDGGATPSGRPYFVMELVKGVPITEYCDQHQLTLRQRLELFIPVCQAVQHAHQKGIIHRDLKPSNILVTVHDTKPMAKVIDFGIAKALGQELTDKTLFTGFAQMLGTPLYMSPEQAGQSGLDVDTRSDIYSLGVLLYELLTGTTPFTKDRFKQATYDEIRRIIREEEPPRPSLRLSDLSSKESSRHTPCAVASERTENDGTRSEPATLASISAQRQVEPARLTKMVRGELDWIVMKALEKDRNRRYESATGLARDIERFLNDEPVRARAPSALYRLRKFVRRNKTRLTVIGAMLFLVLALGGGVAWMMLDRAERGGRVTQRFEQALEDARKLQRQGKWVEAREAIARAQAILASGAVAAYQEQRAVELLADVVMANRLETLDLPGGSVQGTAPAHEGYDTRAASRLGFVRRIDELDSKALARQRDQDYAEAFRHFGVDVDHLEAAVAAERLKARSIRLELAAALDNWAILRRYMVKSTEARWARLLEISALIDGDEQRNQIRAAVRGDDHKALAKLADSDEIKALPPEMLSTLGSLLRMVGETDKALSLLRHGQRRYPGNFWLNAELAGCLTRVNPPRWDEALPFVSAAVAIRPQSAAAHVNLAALLANQANYERAAAVLHEAIRLQPDLAAAHLSLGKVFRRQGKWKEAAEAFGQAVHHKPKDADVLLYLAHAYEELKRHDDALEVYKKALALKPKFAAAHDGMGIAYARKGMFDEARKAYREAMSHDPDAAESYQNMATSYADNKEWDKAIDFYQQALSKNPDFYNAASDLGVAFYRKGDLDAAVKQLKEAMRIQPDNRITYYNIANVSRDKDVKVALWAYRELVRKWPKDAKAHSELGVTLVKMGDAKGGLDALRQATELDPKYKEAYRNQAVALFSLKDSEGAENAVRQALAIDSSYAEGHELLANILSENGPGFLDPALATCLKAIELKKDYAEAYSLLGAIYADKKMFKEAIAAYDMAIRIKADYAPAHYNLADAYDNLGQFKKAADAWREAIKLKPDYFKAHSRLGIALGEQGLLDESIEELREAVKYGKDDWQSLASLAAALEKKGLRAEAIGYRRKVASLEPTDAAAHYSLGTVLLNTRRFDEAIPAFKEAIRLRPKYAEAHCNLGHALQRNGQFAEALPYFRKGHSLGLTTPGWKYPSKNWIASCEKLAELDKRFVRLLHGAARASGPAEQIELAIFGGLEKRYYGAAARWFQEAFAAQPDLADKVQRNHRLLAASVAARAGTGQGEDAKILEPKERDDLRQKAREWLKADLDHFAKELKGKDVDEISVIADRLSHWQKNPHLAGIRDKKELATLPEAERTGCEKLWAEVRDVLREARSRFSENRFDGALVKGEKGKVHVLKTAAGATYVIDLESDAFDPILLVLTEKGKLLAENDDRAPGDLNSRIVFRPKEAGVYRLVVTAFGGAGVGPFTLRVRAFESVEK